MSQYVVAVAALAVALGLVSRHLRQVPVTEPVVALCVGVLLGPRLLGFLPEVESGRHLLLELSRVLLGFTVMTAALRYPWARVRQRARGVGIMLLVVLPLMVATTALLAHWSLHLGWALALLVGAVLAPTDPVLASSVVSGDAAERALPASLRETLSLESAGNDGLALVFVVVGLFLAEDRSGSWLTLHAAGGVVGGIALGVAAGWSAARAIGWSQGGERQTESTFLLFSLTFSVLVLTTARLLGLDGILAVFVAGVAYNRGVSETVRRSQSTIEEGVDRLLMLPVFVLLGAVVPWAGWGDLGWGALLFVVAVLLVRRLPWVLALRGSLRLGWSGALWLGWFGPIGVAALFYATYSDSEGPVDDRLWAVTTLVVATSTVVHGASALPLRRAALSRELEGMGRRETG